MSFREYLKEAAGNYPWDQWRSLGDKVSGHTKTRWVEAIDAFRMAFEKKEIYNADYKDLYSYGLSRGLEKIVSKVKDDWRAKFLSGKQYNDLDPKDKAVYDAVSWDTDYAPNSLKKSLRTVEKFKNEAKELFDFYTLVAPISDMNKELKGFVVSGRKPTAASIANDKKKQQFSQAITREAAKKVVEYLEKASADIKKDYENYFEVRFEKLAREAFEEAEKQHKSLNDSSKFAWFRKIKFKNIEQQMMAQSVLDLSAREPVLVKNWKGIVNKKAVDIVKDILGGFVAKNTQKLAMVVDKKPNLKTIKITRNNIVQGVLNNDMVFDFDDGASFKIYTQTIYKYSKYGKLFTQYPTRFTNVVNSDKTKMSAPNEEKMVKEFY